MTAAPSTAARPSLRLPRACRLKQSRDFARLKSQGRRLACGCLILNWTAAPAEGPSRLGLVTTRKVGSAVLRNRARRLLREAWRRRRPELASPADMVLVARPSIVGKSLSEVDQDLLAALRRAGLCKAAA